MPNNLFRTSPVVSAEHCRQTHRPRSLGVPYVQNNNSHPSKSGSKIAKAETVINVGGLVCQLFAASNVFRVVSANLFGKRSMNVLKESHWLSRSALKKSIIAVWLGSWYRQLRLGGKSVANQQKEKIQPHFTFAYLQVITFANLLLFPPFIAGFRYHFSASAVKTIHNMKEWLPI